ncbi:hypothetical protein BDN72DRAFT_724771, partial [Pluteus cervinus]
CKNCGRFGHSDKDCYSLGGAMEGQRPFRQGQRERAHQTRDVQEDEPMDTEHSYNFTQNSLPRDVVMNGNLMSFDAYDWVADSATTSHI